MLARLTHAEQACLAQILIVLSRKARFAIEGRGARGKLVLTETSRQARQFRFLRAETKRHGIKYRRVLGHHLPLYCRL